MKVNKTHMQRSDSNNRMYAVSGRRDFSSSYAVWNRVSVSGIHFKIKGGSGTRTLAHSICNRAVIIR